MHFYLSSSMTIILITSNLFTSYLIDVELLKVRGLLRDKEIKLKKTEDVLLALNEDIVHVKKR